MGPKLRHAFQEEGEYTFSDCQWLDFFWIGSNTTRFQYCKNSNDVPLKIRAIKGHNGREWIAPELMNHVAIPLDGKNSCNTEDALLTRSQSSKQDSSQDDKRYSSHHWIL